MSQAQDLQHNYEPEQIEGECNQASHAKESSVTAVLPGYMIDKSNGCAEFVGFGKALCFAQAS